MLIKVLPVHSDKVLFHWNYNTFCDSNQLTLRIYDKIETLLTLRIYVKIETLLQKSENSHIKLYLSNENTSE